MNENIFIGLFLEISGEGIERYGDKKGFFHSSIPFPPSFLFPFHFPHSISRKLILFKGERIIF